MRKDPVFFAIPRLFLSCFVCIVKPVCAENTAEQCFNKVAFAALKHDWRERPLLTRLQAFVKDALVRREGAFTALHISLLINCCIALTPVV